MAVQEFPKEYQEVFYTEGFLHDNALSGRSPDYGYRENHLPVVKTTPRKTKSLFEMAVPENDGS